MHDTVNPAVQTLLREPDVATPMLNGVVAVLVFGCAVPGLLSRVTGIDLLTRYLATPLGGLNRVVAAAVLSKAAVVVNGRG